MIHRLQKYRKSTKITEKALGYPFFLHFAIAELRSSIKIKKEQNSKATAAT